MRTPVPRNGHVTRTPVRAELVRLNVNEALNQGDEELPPEETPDPDALDYDDVDDPDDDETEEQKDAREADDGAPWSPVPLRPARDLIEGNDEAQIEVVFPTVYEEDRTAKLADLTTAQTVGAITHRRMAEQMAKELGFESYDYDDELQQIEVEMKKLPPGIMSGGQPPPDAGGMPAMPPVPSTATSLDGIDRAPRRADLSNDATHEFRKQQRSTVSSTEKLSESNARVLAQMLELRRDFVMALQEIRAFREATIKEVGSMREAALREIAVVGAKAATEKQPIINVHIPEQPAPKPSDVKVDVAAPVLNVTIPPPKPKNLVVARDERGLMTGVKESE